MLRTVIIEDEEQLRQALQQMLATIRADVQVIGEAGDIQSGKSLIEKSAPDLIFLDIQLPDGTGFDLLESFPMINFKVIFVTGYMEYAIKGYKFGAIDYILKPFDDEDLAYAINRAHDTIRFEEKLKFKALAESFSSNGKTGRLVLKTSDQVHLVAIDHVIRIEADGNYSTFFLDHGRKVIVSRSIKDYEEMLIDKGFHRIHKSHIINIAQVSYFDKADGGDVIMSDGSKVPVASRKREMLLDLFESMA